MKEIVAAQYFARKLSLRNILRGNCRCAIFCAEIVVAQYFARNKIKSGKVVFLPAGVGIFYVSGDRLPEIRVGKFFRLRADRGRVKSH